MHPSTHQGCLLPSSWMVLLGESIAATSCHAAEAMHQCHLPVAAVPVQQQRLLLLALPKCTGYMLASCIMLSSA
jgi:hypothetical protein